jgi:hypothetical protein
MARECAEKLTEVYWFKLKLSKTNMPTIRDIARQAIQSATQPLERRIEELEKERGELVAFLTTNFPDLCSVDAFPVSRAAFVIRDLHKEAKTLTARLKELEDERDDVRKSSQICAKEYADLTAENAELLELVQWIRNVATGEHQIPDCMCDTEALGHIAGKIDQAKETDKR